MLLFKLTGLAEEEEVSVYFNIPSVKKTVFLEAPSFAKAHTKAKKIFTHIHEIKQIQGEIYLD